VLESAHDESMSPTPEQSLRELLQATPGVRLAVLFGSAGRRRQHASSDLDVGVSFESSVDAGQHLEVELSRVSHRRVDLVRLDEAPPLLRFEIARDGRVLLERVPHAWTDFKARAMVDWWDWAPLAHALQASALKRVREGVGRGTP
jgi:predicted nucleotidyltransferase